MPRQRITNYHTENSPEKKMAWVKNMQITTAILSGQLVIPDDGAPILPLPLPCQYWTLANDQSHEESEISALVHRGFIQPEQFYGVDLNGVWYDGNRAANPSAHFFTDDLLHAMRTVPNSNPSVIYLDTTEGLTKRNLRFLVGTMECCPEGAILFFNFSENNPYDVTHRRTKKKDVNLFIAELKESSGLELSKWNTKVLSYRYNQTGFTNMVTLVFFKRRLA